MPRSVLHQLIARRSDARAVVSAVTGALNVAVAIEDAEGQLLHGDPSRANGGPRFPIGSGDLPLGWVRGEEPASVIARLIDHLASKERERHSLGAEVLQLYREVNLMYSFSEQLAALLDLHRVAELTLHQAHQMIEASDGMLMLLDQETGDLTTVAAFGDEMPALQGFRSGRGIVGAVAESGVGEVVNDVDSDPRRVTERTTLRSLLCAPLKVGERVIGIIALGSRVPMPYRAAELKLLNTLALQSATAIENARLFERTVQAARERERLMALHKEAEVARARLENELELAARIQSALFPAVLPRVPGYELAARNRPARRCGGDYYDALPLRSAAGDGRMLLCVADVSGKGLPAALVMSNMQATLRALLGRVESLPLLAGRASELLQESTAPEKYVTAILVELVPSTGSLTVVGAGHLDNLILRASGSAVTLPSTGAPLALLPVELPYGEIAETLAHGDYLVLYSDGVTEAQNASDEEFGETRLLEVLRNAIGESPDAMIGRAFDAVDVFADGTHQYDDITILVARRLPAR